MKKLLLFLLPILCLPFLFTGCKSENALIPHVSELRRDLFQGESEHFSIKAGYGFKEQPFVNDGKVGSTLSLLTFRLLDKETDSVSYSIAFVFNQAEYHGVFKLNPITHSITCAIEIDNFNLKEFTVKISFGTESEEVLIKSIVPENTISYLTALDVLEKEQRSLISHYTNSNGEFLAEIYLRVLVKDGAPYWYVGFASGLDKLKALLIDGISGEILAIREIF